MKYSSPSNYYCLEVPANWVIEEHDDTSFLYNNKGGLGGINITSYEIPENYEFDIESELNEFIGEKLDLFNVEIKAASVDLAFIEVDEKETYWQYYVLYQSHKALFITYNCALIDKGKEKEEVDNLISSIVIN